MDTVYNFKGLVAAVVTPTNDDGSLNCKVIPAYIDYLLEQGVNGVFVNGTQGEWSSFTVEERNMVAEQWMKHGRQKLQLIIIQCGSLCLKDAQIMAKHAESIGADAISCIAPSFLRAPDEDVLTTFLQEVSESAPKTPFLYYHLPWLTDIEVDMPLFVEHCYKKMPMFCGMKFTSRKVYEAVLAMKFEPRKVKIFIGDDFHLLGALANAGVDAAIGATYNYTAKFMNEVIKAFEERDFKRAREEQLKCSSIFLPLMTKYSMGVGKILTKMFSGIEMGQPRLPLKRISDKDFEAIKKCLVANNFEIKV